MLRSTQPPTLGKIKNKQQITGYEVNAYLADWGGGMSAGCNVGPIVS